MMDCKEMGKKMYEMHKDDSFERFGYPLTRIQFEQLDEVQVATMEKAFIEARSLCVSNEDYVEHKEVFWQAYDELENPARVAQRIKGLAIQMERGKIYRLPPDYKVPELQDKKIIIVLSGVNGVRFHLLDTVYVDGKKIKSPENGYVVGGVNSEQFISELVFVEPQSSELFDNPLFEAGLDMGLRTFFSIVKEYKGLDGKGVGLNIFLEGVEDNPELFYKLEDTAYALIEEVLADLLLNQSHNKALETFKVICENTVLALTQKTCRRTLCFFNRIALQVMCDMVYVSDEWSIVKCNTSEEGKTVEITGYFACEKHEPGILLATMFLRNHTIQIDYADYVKVNSLALRQDKVQDALRNALLALS